MSCILVSVLQRLYQQGIMHLWVLHAAQTTQLLHACCMQAHPTCGPVDTCGFSSASFVSTHLVTWQTLSCDWQPQMGGLQSAEHGIMNQSSEEQPSMTRCKKRNTQDVHIGFADCALVLVPDVASRNLQTLTQSHNTLGRTSCVSCGGNALRRGFGRGIAL